MLFQISAQWAASLNMQHCVVHIKSGFLLRIFWGKKLIELHPDYTCSPRSSNKHFLEKKVMFSFSLNPAGVYLSTLCRSQELNLLCILGKYLSIAITSSKMYSHSRTLSYFSCWMLVLDRKWPEAKRGMKAPLHDTNKSIIIQLRFHYLCLNSMLFKLLMRKRKLLWVLCRTIYYSEMDIAIFAAS